jgi:putative nucleotidyltransferase with HDIG domain
MSTFQHSARVSEYAGRLAAALGLEDADVARIAWAGRLHDLGKIAVDASVLRKPSRLAEEEWTAMRRHPRLSARLLRRFRFAEEEARAVEYHHERFDGGGYYGIDPQAIPLAAHFLIVADSFDAMTSDRTYRRGLPVEEALAEIERHAGSQFHPALARAFVALMRGRDAAAVLTEDELLEIRALGRRRRRRWIPVRGPLPVELAPPVAVIAGLLALAAGRLVLAALGFFAAAVAFMLLKLEDTRGQRLATRLAGALAPQASRSQAFARFRSEFAELCDLRWAGVLTWRERECIGLLELEWSGGAEAPSETSLCGWFVREAESNSPILVVPGAELGRGDTHLAVPLRRDDEVVGCLFVAVAGRVPRSLREGLGAVAPELSARLAPGEGQALARRLEAVAS